MKVGDLIRHKQSKAAALVVKVITSGATTSYKILLCKDDESITAPRELLQDLWEVVDEN